MSLDVLREGALTSRKNELAAVARSQSASLRALREVTAILANNSGLSRLINSAFDTENFPPISSDETSWLKTNSLSSGRILDEATIPYPTIAQDDTSIYVSNPNKTSLQLAQQAQAAASANAPATEASLTSIAPTSTNSNAMATATLQNTQALLHDEGYASSQQTMLTQDGPSAAPSKVAPPQADEEADFNEATKDLLNFESPEKPAKTVHLPPENVQKERLQEQEAEQRRKSSSQRPQPSHLQTQTELASSPSSTVDARSAATPLPPEDSPDTSPDSEVAEEDVPPPKELRPTADEQAEKDEHDRLLEAQKEIARQQALGDVGVDVETPDQQLRWEEREAAAREAEEQAARDDNGPEQNAKDAAGETEAEQVEDAMQVDEETARRHPSASPQAVSSEVVLASQTASSTLTQDSTTEEDGDNITVTPRTKAAKADATLIRAPAESANHAAPPHAVVDQASSPRKRHKSTTIAEDVTLSQSPTRLDMTHRRRSSFEPISPMTMRHTQDSLSAPPTTPAPSSRQVQRSSSQQHTPPSYYPMPGELASLRGAADDPEKDYLEPLFRIQANDANTNRNTPLPELVRSASKTLSTDDQFTSMHERQDYRILRRIYQLQNANKWSLRQMQKSAEPEQPLTHHDHMMAEMKWMRKDFRAERRMKKSVCAWLAQRCADYVSLHGQPAEQRQLRVQVDIPGPDGTVTFRKRQVKEEQLPELEPSGDSAAEDDHMPSTPKATDLLPMRLIVDAELIDTVSELQKVGKLNQALQQLPVADRLGTIQPEKNVPSRSMAQVSRFVEGKVLPRHAGPNRKRSRFDYEDTNEPDDKPSIKRLREESSLPPEDQDNALFHSDNKHIRDRLHANNSFRPPSEFQMPATPFYEFRNGSQWIWEDDQKLRKLAKDYSFNWSLIAEEMTLPSRYKSGMERRTPWECFERWVELETLPAEMRKTMYFKTWFSRLEQSQQAVERRYQAQVQAIQAAQNGAQPVHAPMRRRTLPSRVEKRKNTRYLWLVDAMRKLARKREGQAFKQAEAQRAAAQRKSQTDHNNPLRQTLTPQEWSRRRYDRDCLERAKRQQMIAEAQQRQAQMARAVQQQGLQNGTQQRPITAGAPGQQGQIQVNGQHAQSINGQMPSQPRQALPMATRNGHLAVPQVNAQGIPQAQMRAAGAIGQNPDMQRLAHANAQAQARNGQYAGQQYQMPNASMISPGANGMSTQQQIASNQALLAAFQAQQSNGQSNSQSSMQSNGGQQMSQSPSMPPPPTPANFGQQLSSGLIPGIVNIKAQLARNYPHMTDEQLNAAATEQLKRQSQTSNQARQNAMNAAAGINGLPSPAQANNMQAYNHNQAAFQNNASMVNGTNGYVNGDGGSQQANMSGAHTSPQQNYASIMRQRQLQQLSRMQSPNATHASLSGSPSAAHVSPDMAHVSPSMQYSNVNMGGVAMNGMNGQRPPSRSNTPQMQRLGSSGSVPGVGVPGMQSPGASGLQGSPRSMQAGMAR